MEENINDPQYEEPALGKYRELYEKWQESMRKLHARPHCRNCAQNEYNDRMAFLEAVEKDNKNV